MSEDLLKRLDHVGALVDNDAIEMASSGLEYVTEDFIDRPYTREGSEDFLSKQAEVASKLGIEIALNQAKEFYQKGNIRLARNRLGYANWLNVNNFDTRINDRTLQIREEFDDKYSLGYLVDRIMVILS